MQKTWLLAVATCVVGCAHYPAPNEQLAKSMAAVRGAEEAGAAEVPQAALQLKLAQEGIEQAKKLIASDDNRRAEDKARRASHDAELAVALAHAHTAEGKLSQYQSDRGAGGEAPQTQGATP
jgi:glutamate racemase